MKSMAPGRFLYLVLAVLLILPRSALGKVVFTGYGDLGVNPGSRLSIEGDKAVLNLLGLPGPLEAEVRTFNIRSIGLFASTGLTEKSKFLMDFTYGDIGALAKTLRIQYGYLEYQPVESVVFRAGKITLPIGYFNDHLFYPFQRKSITAPLFISAILGLPIADMGGSLSKTFALGSLHAALEAYGVNGHGPNPGNKTSFRSATLPGGLTIANNIGSSDVNHKIATGGRLRLYTEGKSGVEAGVSAYQDQWDPSGTNFFGMTAAHLLAHLSGFQLRSEYLWLRVTGDPGFAASVGSSCWRTDGFYTTLSYEDIKIGGREIAPWLRYEEYSSQGSLAGKGKEWIQNGAGGVRIGLAEGISLKLEVSRLKYQIPFEGYGSLTLSGWSSAAGLTLTF